MKIFQVQDLLKYQLVRLKAPEGEEFEVHEKILLDYKGDQIVGRVRSLVREVPNAKTDDEYKFVRRLSSAEIEKFEKMLDNEKKHVIRARECAEELKLPMHFFASRTSFDGKILSFFFTSEENIDFRELLRTMAKKFKCRIHLQRAGAREKARIVGGFGICGREACCSFLELNSDRVPMDAVRDQGIMIKNNEKIFGVCGKLKGCLLYELPLYQEKRKYLPHIRQQVKVGKKEGRIVGLDILNKKVKVLFENEIAEIFPVEEVEYENKKVEPEEEKVEDKPLEVDINGIGI